MKVYSAKDEVLQTKRKTQKRTNNLATLVHIYYFDNLYALSVHFIYNTNKSEK